LAGADIGGDYTHGHSARKPKTGFLAEFGWTST
jgi:hypothetical protein